MKNKTIYSVVRLVPSIPSKYPATILDSWDDLEEATFSKNRWEMDMFERGVEGIAFAVQASVLYESK